MRQTREQRFTELLQASTTSTTATSLVHAIITDHTRTGWAWFFFGAIGGAIAGAQHRESGFAMIDEGKIYFYRVNGLGKRRVIEGRREIAFDQLERVRRVRGGRRTPATLNIRWKNNNNKLLELTLGGGSVRQFPNQQANVNEMTQLILANSVEIKPDRTAMITLLVVFGVFAGALILILLIYLSEYFNI